MIRFGTIDIDNPVWRFLGYIFDAAYLTILWLVFAIPIFTIGASTTALYTVSLRMLRKEESSHTAKAFYEAFRANFSQGTLAGIIMALLGTMLSFVIAQIVKGDTSVLAIIYMVFAFVYLMILKFIFPVIARFSDSLSNLYAISFVLAVKNFGWTLMMIVLSVSFIVVSIFVFWPLIIFSVGAIALIDSWVLNNIFANYIEENSIK